MINKDQLDAAEEAFGTHIVEPYIGMRMKTGKKFNKGHSLIYDLYLEDKNVVNDEMLLLARIWYIEGFDNNDGTIYDRLKKVTHPETISRRRRDLHEAGLIKYADKAMEARTEAFKSYRDESSPVKYALFEVNGEKVMKPIRNTE
jgi:hypothetical protein